jgi:hypothetical protein
VEAPHLPLLADGLGLDPGSYQAQYPAPQLGQQIFVAVVATVRFITRSLHHRFFIQFFGAICCLLSHLFTHSYQRKKKHLQTKHCARGVMSPTLLLLIMMASFPDIGAGFLVYGQNNTVILVTACRSRPLFDRGGYGGMVAVAVNGHPVPTRNPDEVLWFFYNGGYTEQYVLKESPGYKAWAVTRPRDVKCLPISGEDGPR